MEKTQRKELLALWQKESKKGELYFTGKGGIVGFYNPKKQNPKEPDLRLHIRVGEELQEYGSVWVNVSDKGNKYLTGTLVHGNVRIVGFINTDTQGGKHPYIRFYEQDKKEVSAQPKQAVESEKITPTPTSTKDLPKEVKKTIKDDDLPF